MTETLHEKGVEPPMVSVVIPTRDRRLALERCLDALAYQTHANYEVIVVDDGSSDDTQAFLQQFTADHPGLQLTCLRNDTPIGANGSRNRGIGIAEGRFVAFIDSDCVAEGDWLEELVRGFTGQRVAAVTGTVRNPPPANIYELTYRGTNRVHGSPYVTRLVGCNMGIRRELLLTYMLDEDRAARVTNPDGMTDDITVSGRGDEEGLYLMLRAAGYEQLAAPDAVVLHEHHYTGRTFFKQAFRGGRSAARLVYKYYLPPRLDMLPFMLTYLTLPLLLVQRWLGLLPAVFFAAALAAIVYNDLFRKGKTIGETVRSFPVLLAYYHVRLFGYVTEAICLRLGKHEITRQRL